MTPGIQVPDLTQAQWKALKIIYGYGGKWTARGWIHGASCRALIKRGFLDSGPDWETGVENQVRVTASGKAAVEALRLAEALKSTETPPKRTRGPGIKWVCGYPLCKNRRMRGLEMCSQHQML